jgi:hypothetical protein
MVTDESQPSRVQAREHGLEEEAGPAGIEGAEPLPIVGGEVLAHGGLGGIVGVGHGVEVFRFQPCPLQAPPGGLLGQLPGGEGHGGLAVLAAREALLLRRRDEPAVHDDCRRRIVENGVNPQDTHSG